MKAAGIDTNGDVVKTVATPNGGQLIRFSRPTYRYIWVQATLTLLTGADAAFPADGYETVRADLNAIGQKLQVGDDVVAQKFYCGVFKTAGVESVAFKFASTDWLTRVLTRGQYSHCEIAMRLPENDETGAALYDCYSASIRDGEVRWKRMPLPAEKWDLIDMTDDPLIFPMFFSVWEFTKGQPYDLTGAFGVVFNFRQNPRRWFCSEWCAGVLGLDEPWRFSPNDLAAIYQNSKAELLRRRK